MTEQRTGPPGPANWGVAGALLALVLVGGYLRLSGLAPWHLAWDEAWHLLDALQQSPAAVLERNLQRQVHGPVGYLLWYGAAQLTTSPFLLRFSSLVPGLLLIPACYLLGRLLLGRGAGIFLAVMATFSYRLVVLGQVLRPYAPLLLLITLALVALLLYERTGRRRALVAYFALAALACLTHVSALIPISCIAGLWGLRIARGQSAERRLLPWIALHVVLVLGSASYSYVQLYFAGGEAADPSSNHQAFVRHFYFFQTMFPEGPTDALRHLYDLHRLLFFAPDSPPWIGWAVILPSALGVVLLVRQSRFDVLALSASVVAGGLLLGWLHLYPFAPTRHSVYLVPFLLLPAAMSAQWVGERQPLLLAGFGLGATLLLFPLQPGAYRPLRVDFDTKRVDLERAFQHLATVATERDVVVVNRVGMLYLNLEERLFERELEHVAHSPDHARYEFDRWVGAGEEEHRYRGITFWGCDRVHEWSSFLRGGLPVLKECLRGLAVARGSTIDKLWFLVEKPDLFLVLASTNPLAGVSGPGREELRGLARHPFWSVLFTERIDWFRTPTTGTFSVPWKEVEAQLGRRLEPTRGRPGARIR
ncbi:MAG: glycosyltransferase family 39 protein [Myxococcota bacterium]